MPRNWANPRTRLATVCSLCVALSPLIAAANTARGQNAEVSASASGDIGPQGAQASSRIGASFAFIREYPVPPIADPDDTLQTCCFFAYHGVKRDARDGFGFNASADLSHAESADGGSTELFVAQSAFAELRGWRLEQLLDYQRPVQFSDPFWRSSSRLGRFGGAVSVPPMWAIGIPEHALLWAFRGRVGYSELLRRENGAFATRAFDVDVSIEGLGIQTDHTETTVFNIRFREQGAPLARSGDVLTGESVTSLDWEMARLELTFDRLALEAAGGFSLRGPLGRFRSVQMGGNVSSVSDGQLYLSPRLWFGGALARGGSMPFDVGAGVGAFSRVSPDGFGADAGYRGELSVTGDVTENVALTVTADLAQLVRQGVSELAPLETDGPGTRYLLARGTAAAAVPLREGFSLTASAYVEQSDRDDPRIHAKTPDPDDIRFGAEIGVTYSLD